MKTNRLLLPVCLVCFTLYACTDDKQPAEISFVKNGEMVRGRITPDSVYLDTMLFYDITGKQLLRKVVYANGKPVGQAFEYNSAGKPAAIRNFSDGLENGYSYTFDADGRCNYQYYSYYGVRVGPAIFWNPDGSPRSFYFTSFSNQDLFKCGYDQWEGGESLLTSLAPATVKGGTSQGGEIYDIFLYLMSPPRVKVDYSVEQKTGNGNEYRTVSQLSKKQPFTQVILPVPADGSYYRLRLDVYDSILNRATVVYKVLEE